MYLPSQSTPQQVENYKYLVNSSLNLSAHFHNIYSSVSLSRIRLCYVGPAKRETLMGSKVHSHSLFKQYPSSYEDLLNFQWQIYQC